jgi:sugar lactone lactonase YvrE
VLALLAGCATEPKEKLAAVPAPIFYPRAPDAPRIQYLTTFTGSSDFETRRSGFSQFIAGDEQSQSLVQIYGVALAEGRLYAVDSKGGGVAVFDLVKREFSVFTGTGAGQMRLPINLTIDSDGTKYVTDTGRNQVLLYDRANHYLGAYGEPDQFKPVDTAIIGDKLYVVDIRHHEIHVLNKRTGKLIHKFAKAGSKAGELFNPTNIAVGPDGDIFVVETGNYRVQRFTPEGTPVRTYGEVGDSPGKFARPKGIAIDRQGRFYVSDAAFQNVQVFSQDGQVLMGFGQPDNAAGLSLPAAVKIDYDNVGLFKRYADPNFSVEYVILVASQIAPNKVDVFGFGRMAGFDYAPQTPAKP